MEVHSLMMHLYFIFGVFSQHVGTQRAVSVRLDRMPE